MHGGVSSRTTDLTQVRWARSTYPSCRKHDVRLAARTTDGVVNYNDMVSDREDEDLGYERLAIVTIKVPAPLRSGGIAKSSTRLTHGGRPCLPDRHKNLTQSGRDKFAGSPGPGIISTGTAAVFLV
ncbi:hypothetical protein B296_00041572 [Ensete ventricosum]|uniref:Uncharacterized protein n=1 Tax=Ensete ventricosum TaxID=4639 RepID=A0A426XXE2_ENSVE|nr:hypothetical protein B296_00041572 [Ensete ventricosum]